MNADLQNVRAFAANLQITLSEALEVIRTEHPLLRQAIFTPATRVILPADVNADQPMIATYDVPQLASGVSLQLDPSITTIDRLAEATGEIIDVTLYEYERDLRTGLYMAEKGFLGVAGLLPREVGANVIGGIHEATTPGWRSQVTQTRPSMYETFAASEARCSGRGKSPDLTILGTNAYRELVNSIQPQQRFTSLVAGIPTLRLHAGALFHDPFCHADAGYTLHTSDFEFHASPFDVMVEIGLEGRMRVQVRRHEQLLASRRFRSGTITTARTFIASR